VKEEELKDVGIGRKPERALEIRHKVKDGRHLRQEEEKDRRNKSRHDRRA
jgi:hypothetical protein